MTEESEQVGLGRRRCRWPGAPPRDSSRLPRPRLRPRQPVIGRPQPGAEAPPPGRIPSAPERGISRTSLRQVTSQGETGTLSLALERVPETADGGLPIPGPGSGVSFIRRQLEDPSTLHRVGGQPRPSSGSWHGEGLRPPRSWLAPSNAERNPKRLRCDRAGGKTAVASLPRESSGPETIGRRERRPDPPFSWWCMFVG